MARSCARARRLAEARHARGAAFVVVSVVEFAYSKFVSTPMDSHASSSASFACGELMCGRALYRSALSGRPCSSTRPYRAGAEGLRAPRRRARRRVRDVWSATGRGSEPPLTTPELILNHPELLLNYS